MKGVGERLSTRRVAEAGEEGGGVRRWGKAPAEPRGCSRWVRTARELWAALVPETGRLGRGPGRWEMTVACFKVADEGAL